MIQDLSKSMIIFLAVAVFSAFAPAWSEESQAQEEAISLKTVIVTAGKKEEDSQKVPAGMDVFSNVQLEDAGIENTYDLTRFSPNVTMKQNYTEHVIVIRGIPSFRGSTHSPAGLYIDDASYPLHYTQNTALFDVERVEILKGPQGTLYGSNTESGIVNIITRQPGNEFSGKVFGEYGSDSLIRSGAAMSGPIITDTFFLGGAFQYKTSDGFIDNLSNGDEQAADQEQVNGRASLRWTPTEALDFSFIADVVSAENHIGGYRFISGAYTTSPHEVKKDEDESYEEDNNSQVLRIKYKGRAFDLLSVSSHLDQSLDRVADSDMTDISAIRKSSYFEVNTDQFSQELRVLSSNKGPFEWIGGIYGFNEKSDFELRQDLVYNGTIKMHPVMDIDTKGIAAFGQATYSPLATLHLTAGIRFDHQTMDGDLYDITSDSSCKDELTYDEFLPKFAVAYDVSDDVMAYGSVTKGYLVGGFNWLKAPVLQTFTYDAEYTWNYEVGLKTTWLNGKLLTNLALFYTKIDDKQVSEYDPETYLNEVTNAASAHSQGLEFDVKAMPAQGVELFAGFGITESEFDTFMATEWNGTKTALQEKDYSGNALPYAPKYTYNAGVQFRGQSGFFCRADIMGSGKFYGDAENTASQSSYQTMNLRLGYEEERFDLYLWARNLFDEEYLTYVSPYGSTANIGLDGEPLTVGVTLVMRF